MVSRKGFSIVQKLLLVSGVVVFVGGMFFLSAFGGTKFGSTLNFASVQNSIDTGLIAHYTFDGVDMSSGQVNDRSGNGNHGSMVNMATSSAYVDGVLGQGIRTDGTNDYIQFPVTVATDAAADDVYSWSVWTLIASTGPSQIIMSATDNDGRGDANTIFEFSVDGTASNFSASVAANNSGAVNSAITFNAWTHLVGVKNGSRLDFYINGELVGTDTSVNSAAALTPTAFRIGRPNNNVRYFDGKTDDARVYTRALSVDDVKHLYQLGATTHISGTPTPSSRPGSVNNGLVAHYTFDGKDMPSGQVNDISGNDNHGSQINMATSTAYSYGMVGQALDFDGANDKVDAGSAASLDDLSLMSISFWMNARSLGGSSNGNIVQKHSANSANPSDGWVVVLNTNNTINFRVDYGTVGISTDDLRKTSANDVVVFNTWNHYVITWNGTNASDGVHIYKDGIEVSYGSNQEPTGDRNTDAAQTLKIGNSISNSRAFNGKIDDARIYNRVLSSDDVKHLYQLGATTHISGTPTPSSSPGGVNNGLVAHYTFDGKDMPSGQVNDVSGGGNHGSMVSMPTSTSRAFGAIGQALFFDNNSVITFPSQTFSGPFTASLWWKENVSDGLFHMALGKSTSGTVEKFGINSNNTHFFVRVLTSGSADTSVAIPSHKEWHHVALIRDSADKIDLIVDGGSPNRLFSDAAQSGDSLWGLVGGHSGQRFLGTIDDVRLYNRALTLDEVKTLYQFGQ